MTRRPVMVSHQSAILRVTTGLTLLLAASPPAAAQLARDSAASIDRVFARLNRTDAPGCVVGLDRDGRPLYRKGYGMASLEFAVPLDENSVSESGSVAKQFTAAAVAYLAVQGKLALEDEVRKYIPELRDYGTPVTIRMLLNHTSGVRDMWTLFTVAGQPLGENLFSMDRALAMVYRQRELNFPPNSQFLYSNSGFLLLSEIVKRVSGMPLDRFSQEIFFRPLGMTHTQWRSDWNRIVPGRVTAYVPADSGGFRVDMPYMSVYGAGGLLTTVGDLLIWNENLTHPRVGGQAFVDSMQRQGRLTSGRQIDYALGLFLDKYRDEPEVQHSGATGGYRTFLARYPKRGLSVAVLCNVGNANPIRLGRQVIDVFMGPASGPDGRSATAEPAGTTVGPDELANFPGKYRASATEEVIAISAKNGKLTANLGFEVPLIQVSKNRFTSSANQLGLTFETGPTGRPTRLTSVNPDGDTTHYEPVTTAKLTGPEAAALAGPYYSDELDATYFVTPRDTAVAVRIGALPEVVYPRTGRDSFARPGSGIRFTRGKTGRIDGLLIFAGRVRNLHFVKR
ncbi:MAG: serine hydrolase domain-containing protein [Gemmatimonadota bacterium]